MTYGMLKKLTQGLLIGDNALSKDDEVIKALLSLAYNMISNKAESLHLLTMDRNDDILRPGTGDYLIRIPNLPEGDKCQLDIDDDLGYVAARYIASFVAKDSRKIAIHVQEAESMIMKYNEKVDAIINRVKYKEEEKEHYV